MPPHKFLDLTSSYQRLIPILGILIGTVIGLMAAAVPQYLIIVIVAIVVLVCTIYFVKSFEQVILGFLIIRSSLDAFSSQQIPALTAIAIDLVTLVYIGMLLLSKQKVQLDGFWCFFAGWIALQGLWVILLPLGGLGLDASVLSISIREWVRMFSWLMLYLLIMQFKDRLHPEKVIYSLFLSLFVPLVVGSMQLIFPPSMLPSFLVFERGSVIEAGSRINGTLGHPNTFATFLLLFIGLALWKINSYQKRRYWIILVAVLAFFLVSTSSLTGMIMLVAFMVAYFVPRFSAINLIAGLGLLAVIGLLFVSSDLGQERLQSLSETPLLNPDIDWSRAVLLQWKDGNSFNWRIAQWTYLLQSWQKYPIWGYGLGTAKHLSIFANAPHNDYLRFLVEEGIVGFIAFLAFLLAQFVNLLQLIFSAPPTSPQRNLGLMMLAYFVAILVGMLSGNILLHTTMFFYWWTLMAISAWDWQPSLPDT